MVALVSVETVLLVLLVVLVAALLRSHAEILRRLGPEDATRRACPAPPAGVRADTAAPELAGVTPTGDAVKLALDRSADAAGVPEQRLHELRRVLGEARRRRLAPGCAR